MDFIVAHHENVNGYRYNGLNVEPVPCHKISAINADGQIQYCVIFEYGNVLESDTTTVRSTRIIPESNRYCACL